MSAAAAPPLRMAATVIVARDVPTGGIEVLMVKRHSKSSFMANAYVYPGGALDPEDEAEALRAHVCGRTAEEASAQLGVEPALRALGLYVAGVRETFEESGLLLARRSGERGWVGLTEDAQTEERFAAYRAKLRANEVSLGHVLQREGLIVDLREVGVFAHWLTPTFESKRFDTHFFVVRAPTAQRPLHDEEETVAHRWITPTAALDRYAAGDWFLAPPTAITLSQLVRFETTAALLQHSATYRPPTLLPHLERRPDGPVLLLPGDPEFPADDPAYAVATPNDEPWTRLVLRDGVWERQTAP